MKKILLLFLLFIYSFPAIAGERSDSFICSTNRSISIIFDYNHRQISIYGNRTLILNVLSVGEHYLTPEGDNGVDMETKDKQENKYTCSFILHENEKGKNEEKLIVRHENAILTFKMIKVNVTPGG